MQAQILAETPESTIRILGVNAFGEEGGNGLVTADAVLPWLQDTAAANVWGLWDVTYRDVIVLDGENRVVAVYNLTANNLGIAEKYGELLAILREAEAAEGE